MVYFQLSVRVCVCVGGGGGGGRLTSCIWHSIDVCVEWPPFSVMPGIWLAPYSTKSIWLTWFFLNLMWKAPLFWFFHIPVNAYIFSLRDLSRLFHRDGSDYVDLIFTISKQARGKKKKKKKLQFLVTSNIFGLKIRVSKGHFQTKLGKSWSTKK